MLTSRAAIRFSDSRYIPQYGESCSSQRAGIQIARVHFRLVSIRVKNEERAALDGPTCPVLRNAECLEDLVERLLGDGECEMHWAARLMSPRGVCDLDDQVAALALKVRPLLIALVEGDSAFVVVEVDRPIQIVNLEKD